jgi:cation diffusion facilitator family transporter
VKARTTRKEDVIAYEGKKLAVVSAALNIFFTATKFSLFLLSGSSALLAETAHSLTDVIGSLLVIGGIYLSGKKAEQFPWGLYKVENIVALLSAGMIFLSSYEIAAVIVRPSPEGLKNLDITLTVLFLMVFPIIFFSRYEAKRAKAINSPSLMADAKHWRMDIAPLVIVAAGITGAQFSYPGMDRISAFAILLVVIKAGYGILRDSIKSLLDASVDRATLDKIKGILVEGFPQVKEIVSLQARNSGRFIFVTMDLGLSSKRLKDAHKIADDIETEIKRQIPFVGRVIIHYEPQKKDYQRFAVPLAGRDGEISEHFAKAPFIALWDKRISDGRIQPPEILENPFTDLEKGKGMRFAELLVERDIDVLYTKEDFEGKGPSYVLSDAEIEVSKTDMKTLNELIEKE